MTYLNHKGSNQSRKYTMMDCSVPAPGLNSADKFMKRGLHRMKELQEITLVIVSTAKNQFLKNKHQVWQITSVSKDAAGVAAHICI